jgi:hypothetical protein
MTTIDAAGGPRSLMYIRRRAMLLSPAAAALFAAAVAAADVSIQLDPYCDNSIRVRLRPAAPPVAPGLAAVSWSSPHRADSVLCLSDDCTHSESTSGYTKGAIEGYAPGAAAPPNSTIELAVYYQHQHTDNLVGPANSESAAP